MKITERLHRAQFNWAVGAVRKTPPLRAGQSGFVALSMVQHRDVLPYLLALKSFARFLQPDRVVLVADPTLDASDRNLLLSHVPHIEIREATEFQREGIPKGGCWERLNAISEYAKDAYVVQLDADTVALQDLPEVRNAIQQRVSFSLGTEDVQPIISCVEAAEWAKPRLDGQDHTQLVAESKLDGFDPEGKFKYARACAGFAGFAPGSISPALVQQISNRMAELVGAQWAAWGTEQFTSNLIVCSSPGARLLPHPTYCHPGRKTVSTIFLHFIGFVRFANSLYSTTARQISKDLAKA